MIANLVKSYRAQHATRTSTRTILALFAALASLVAGQIQASKAQVSETIRHVEDGTDEFRKYLESRGTMLGIMRRRHRADAVRPTINRKQMPRLRRTNWIRLSMI